MYKIENILQRLYISSFHQKSKFMHQLSDVFKITDEVADNLINKKPVVALESTVITHGLPYPDNLQCALRLEEIVRQNKAVPATIGILNGVVHIGMDTKKIEILANSKGNVIKVSRRDLPYVISKGMNGGTTVAATMILAHKAGIPIFVSGGIGGVHRGAQTTMDISADLYELSKTPMTVISAGVKSILDIGLTLEYLETLGVCVATFGSSKMFPSFFTPESEFYSSCNLVSAIEAAKLIDSRDCLKLGSGILLAVPIPKEYYEDGQKAHSVIHEALEEAQKKHIVGKNITPFVLDRVHSLSGGASLRANIGLLENNAHVGSQIAVALSELQRGGLSSPRAMLSPVKHEATDVFSSSKPVVIGGSNLDIHVKVIEDIKMDGRTVGGKVYSTAGGVGRNVADCMARLGADPFFISAVGSKEYAQTLLSKMEHMDIRGIKKLPDARTATCVIVLDNDGECAFLVGDMSIHDRILPEQVETHSDIIAKAPMVVFDSNIPQLTINCIVKLCSKYQVPVWFEPTDISHASKPFKDSIWRSAIGYASPNLSELRVMHDAIMGKTTPPLQDDCFERKLEESLRLGIPLLKDALHTLTVTLGAHGILLITTLTSNTPFPTSNMLPKTGHVRAIHYPAPIPDSIISVTGAGDCFAAAMVTAILRGLNPETCVGAGQIAAGLALASHHAVPDSMCPDIVFGNTASLKKNPMSVL